MIPPVNSVHRKTVLTDRLFLRRPTADDVPLIFDRYATDAEVTRYLAWPRHTTLDHTRTFLAFSDSEWQRWSTGPLLAFSREDGTLLGSTGLAFDTPAHVSTGYVFARDAWGHGYATEALAAMVTLARSLRIERLHAVCHVEHQASARVLEKCGFTCDGIVSRHVVFPNLTPDPQDVLAYSRAV